ncbi:hypothetical protein [Acidomonas methanolica]|uniref:Uncharacterized protein n=1 Tax=Acidomonas methanolica NBRC 104435 TaxID=1231351 RepID=A0A023D6P1_ACIMT|nr:hypothetical protein [Acidomonas methanolica]TCS24104.1 hypothetical protein EDC31_12525 [Acidomonas methanolica]GAJ29744.1 hypothetical protein Amme_076_037 [Acidomonas methanolica NBRC 104435]GEL00019.1 hypothetical protein AME01nite_25170 [Acidomonas methanolica NBRC 104435]
MTLLADIKRRIIAPVVLDLALPGDDAARVQLHAGIGNVETGFRAKLQAGGPALGFWQMEPATHDDCWHNWLWARPALAQVVLGYLPARFKGVPNVGAMIESDSYAVAMSVIRFRRSPVALPPRNDAGAQCTAWKAGYNSALGAGEIDGARIALFQEAIDA